MDAVEAGYVRFAVMAAASAYHNGGGVRVMGTLADCPVTNFRTQIGYVPFRRAVEADVAAPLEMEIEKTRKIVAALQAWLGENLGWVFEVEEYGWHPRPSMYAPATIQPDNPYFQAAAILSTLQGLLKQPIDFETYGPTQVETRVAFVFGKQPTELRLARGRLLSNLLFVDVPKVVLEIINTTLPDWLGRYKAVPQKSDEGCRYGLEPRS